MQDLEAAYLDANESEVLAEVGPCHVKVCSDLAYFGRGCLRKLQRTCHEELAEAGRGLVAEPSKASAEVFEILKLLKVLSAT